MIATLLFILAGLMLIPAVLAGFSLNAHLTAAEYAAKTALKKDEENEEQEYKDLEGLYGMFYNGKMLIIWTWRLFCKLIWLIPPLFLILPKPKPIFAGSEPREDEEDNQDNIPVDRNSMFFKTYRGLQKYERGYLWVSIAYLLTRKSKVSKGLGAAALTSVGVRKKRESERKKLKSEREQREAEQRAEREKQAQLQKMEDDLRIRAYPDEEPPVIGEDETSDGIKP